MKKLPLLAAAAMAAATLAACQSEPEVVSSRAPDPYAEAKKKAGPVELPPSIRETVTFRCKDNSLVYVDFFNGDKLANIKTDPKGTPTQLRAAAPGEAFTADGYSLTGDAKNVTVTLPGKGELTCKA
ncbi:hypothetical protein NYR55_13020 [Sphingomonas sp. BGYR3]|uniref:hypothetical protein n=1 Tax=Sphingomonas sp. BGYR3 TaxID=2975483 RepID=UPI0021A57861|nr:hypothetical protein [Sphingomonas sp. BGYR3]MDG5489539.1 hypothetical protein [Sphingomonas sp. BGYR3]